MTSSRSRPRQPPERRGRGRRTGCDYHFLSREEFARRADANEFLEHAAYSGNRYGTLRSEVERRLAAGESVVLEIEVQGARQVRAAMPEAVLVFIAPPDPAALRERLERRGTDRPEAIDERLRTAEIELDAQQEFAACGRAMTIWTLRRRSWSGSSGKNSPLATSNSSSPTLPADDQASR